ncbi:ATP-binding protein [Flavobacterium sp.]|uniref:ATP-binding protein n=1 Tax=Flavobacterium sp. TaxID=239 RepID=UPI003C5768FB
MKTHSLRKENTDTITRELQWLSIVIDTRFKLYFNNPTDCVSIFDVTPPDISTETSCYALSIKQYNLNFFERVILALALAPHFWPHLLDVFFVKNNVFDRGFSEFGGIEGKQHKGFLPTGETAAFILAADNLEDCFTVLDLFSKDSFFNKNNILKLIDSQPQEPYLSGILSITENYLNYLIAGLPNTPEYSINFQATQITTPLEWGDLVADNPTLEQIGKIKDLIETRALVSNELEAIKKKQSGLCTLFYGLSGTGKTLTAALIGKSTGRAVLRVDLSQVVSKNMEETEKNLANIFDQAENKDWILFFDNADALFEINNPTTDSNEKYSFQQRSYVLQRIECYPGTVIIASNTNLKIDETFTNRFESIIHFTIPSPEQRLRLWKNSFSDPIFLADTIKLEEIAEKYELTGGAILNITRYCIRKAQEEGLYLLLEDHLLEGIRQEMTKDEKIYS